MPLSLFVGAGGPKVSLFEIYKSYYLRVLTGFKDNVKE